MVQPVGDPDKPAGELPRHARLSIPLPLARLILPQLLEDWTGSASVLDEFDRVFF